MLAVLRLEDLRIATPGLKGAGMHIHPRLLRPPSFGVGAYMAHRCQLPLRLRDRCHSLRPPAGGSFRGIGLAPGQPGRLDCMGEGQS